MSKWNRYHSLLLKWNRFHLMFNDRLKPKPKPLFVTTHLFTGSGSRTPCKSLLKN
jgi:hypothetical protein